MYGYGELNAGESLSPQAIVASGLIHSLHKPRKWTHIIQHIKKKMKEHPHHHNIIGTITNNNVRDFIKKHSLKDVHIRDVLGKKWNQKKKKIIDILKRHQESAQSGSGFLKSLRHLTNRGIHELRRFIDGKTKIKPHHLAQAISTAAELAKIGLAMDPRTKALVPVAAMTGKISQKASKYLKKHGRGVSLSGGEYQDELDGAGMQSASGLKLSGAGLKLSGAGLSLSGYPKGVSISANGKVYRSKASVWHGYHKKTKGGLTKNDLMISKGKIISKKKHALGKRMQQEGKGIFSSR